MSSRPPIEWTRSRATPPALYVPPAAGDALGDFLCWYGAHGPAWPAAPIGALSCLGGLPALTLYRAGAFQVQLFLFPAGTDVPEHRHPNVDTIEMHVAGALDFRVAGEPTVPRDFLADRRAAAGAVDVSRWWGRGVRVRPGAWHSLAVGAGGGAFLSVQHWLCGSAGESVGRDWEGRPVNARHALELA